MLTSLKTKYSQKWQQIVRKPVGEAKHPQSPQPTHANKSNAELSAKVDTILGESRLKKSKSSYIYHQESIRLEDTGVDNLVEQ